jgi:hypothetical protein
VLTASIIKAMMEAIHTSEMSVHFNVTTRHYIPEDPKLHTHCREKLKSHKPTVLLEAPSGFPWPFQVCDCRRTLKFATSAAEVSNV